MSNACDYYIKRIHTQQYTCFLIFRVEFFSIVIHKFRISKNVRTREKILYGNRSRRI